MSVRTCTHYRTAFWAYPKSDLPAGYCSWKCFDGRRKTVYLGSQADLPPAPPTEITAVLKLHLEKAHGTSDLTKWFETCQICERLNEALMISQRSMI
jgi:hypothetical protein